jgi:hypothetical protein
MVFWLLGVKPILRSLWIIAGTSLLSSGWSILGYELSEWGLGFQVCINLQILSLPDYYKRNPSITTFRRENFRFRSRILSYLSIVPSTETDPSQWKARKVDRSEKLKKKIDYSEKLERTSKSFQFIRARFCRCFMGIWHSPKQQIVDCTFHTKKNPKRTRNRETRNPSSSSIRSSPDRQKRSNLFSCVCCNGRFFLFGFDAVSIFQVLCWSCNNGNERVQPKP